MMILSQMPTTMQDAGRKSSSRLGGCYLLCSYALACLGQLIRRHASANVQQNWLRALQLLPESSLDATCAAFSSPSRVSSIGTSPIVTPIPASDPAFARSVTDADEDAQAHAQVFPLLPSRTLLRIISALIALHEASRAWERATWPSTHARRDFELSLCDNPAGDALTSKGGAGGQADTSSIGTRAGAHQHSPDHPPRCNEVRFTQLPLALGVRHACMAPGMPRARSQSRASAFRLINLLIWQAEQEECSVRLRSSLLAVISQTVDQLDDNRIGRECTASQLAASSSVVAQLSRDRCTAGCAWATCGPTSCEDTFATVLAAFEDDLEHGSLPVPLLIAYLTLLNKLVRRCSGSTRDRSARTARSVLTSYSIDQPGAVKGLLRLLLSSTHPETAAAAAAADVCESALSYGHGLDFPSISGNDCSKVESFCGPGCATSADRCVNGGCDEVQRQPSACSMKLYSSLAIRAAAVQMALGHWKGLWESAQSTPPNRESDSLHAFREFLASLKRGLAALFDSSFDVAQSPSLVPRVIALMSSVFALATRSCMSFLPPQRMKAEFGENQGSATPATGTDFVFQTLRGWIVTWTSLVPLMYAYAAWLRRGGRIWSTACRKRLPMALCLCERMQLTLFRALESKEGSSIARGLEPACADLLHAVRCDWSGSVGDGSRLGVGARGQTAPFGGSAAVSRADANGVSAAAVSSQQRDASRRRLRSRNPYIDSELGLSGHSRRDDFADLEQFIVCKRGRRY